MAHIVLGLDIGPSSIGWSLADESQKTITAAGVRVFPEGVDHDNQGGEKSKSQERRTKRGMRRQIARRAARRRALRRILTERGLLPSDQNELGSLLAANPYPLRDRAVGERLSPHEIGRILLHLNQRRGFLSNRKTDRGSKESDAKGMLGEIATLQKEIENSGAATLGQYLARLHATWTPDESQSVRKRHTRREMLLNEFNVIWESQQRFHPELLTAELRRCLYNPEANRDWVCRGLLFGQRRVYYPLSVVGRCELELKKKRCPRSDRAAQRFRILQEVNNLRLVDRATGEERQLSDDERATLLDYLGQADKRTFDQIRKKLDLPESVHFNLEGPERKYLKGNQTDAAFANAKCLGKKWKSFTDTQKDDIAAIVADDAELSDDEALDRLKTDFGLSDEEAAGALRARLPDGYASYCRDAILRLLPHLERGLALMGNDASDSALHAAGYLRPDEREVKLHDLLPPSPDLPNPIVRQALVEVRKVVNGIIRTYGRPDTIRIELARQAKASFEDRKRQRFDNADRQKARSAAVEMLEQHGAVSPTAGLVTRYVLWKEQGETCIYSGRPISINQLIAGEVDEDHILPRWRSLDDSKMNRVVCFRNENNDKGDRTPREWLEESDQDRWDDVLRRAEKLPYPKFLRFLQKDIVLDSFVARQLTDTAYITRLVSQYLRGLGAPVECVRGGMTAELRRSWGLNGILGDTGEKNRADHRHHAIDAIIIALTDRKRLHALANARGRDVPPPWKGVREHAAAIIQHLRVSHRSLRGIRGALHEDTFYGATQKSSGRPAPGTVGRRHATGWIEDEGAFVRRKPIESLTDLKHIAKVRDPAIRRVLLKHLAEKNVDVSRKSGAIPKDAFKGANIPRMPSGVPIKKVRMIEEGKTFRQVSEKRPFHYVKPGSNHHIVYREVKSKGKTKWIGEVTTMWDAAQRAKRGPVVDRLDRADSRFVMSLTIGEAFEIDGTSEERVLCVVRKMDQLTGRLHYKEHRDARTADLLKGDNLYLSPEKMRALNATKVLVDPIGRVRYARD